MTSLPGAPQLDPDLAGRLLRELASKGPGYEPRTHHLRPDGSPRWVNRLILETSPYLLQHAHNPVAWHAWGDEAFAAARQLGRPVLLSVGYSTCHWCHVMERESFEDEEIARFINAHYIAIKVDREERPDIDAVYMSAVQMMVGRGGWPMTVFLSPDGRPFYGGTYFPPRDGDRGAQIGFLTLLQRVHEQYRDRPDELARASEELTEQVRRVVARSAAGTRPAGPEVLSVAAAQVVAMFDPQYGGARGAPKFPSSFPVRFLLREHARTGERPPLDMALVTLERMARGGIHDQIGGGFHRYSTDARWLVPHFEKMLYDNALLAVAYLEGYQAGARDDFADVARGILGYVRREMTAPGGGFYSATDADSLTPTGHAEEGWFFSWTPGEIEAVLGPERAAVVCAYHGVTPGGNFEGRSVLHVPDTAEEVARRTGRSAAEVRRIVAESREPLYAARARRPPPLRDEKILTSWNGLMISAFAIGGQVLSEPGFTREAERAAEFVLANLRRNGRLLRSFKDGQARHNAYLDDYAFLIAGLVDLYEASSAPRWLREALDLQKTLDERYADTAGGYFMTSDDHETLIAREKPSYDGAEPSGNSVAVMNLLRLSELTGDDRYRARAVQALASFGGLLERTPTAMSEMLLAVGFHVGSPREIVLVTAGSRDEARPFLAELGRRFVPHRVVVVASEGPDLEAQAALVPLLAGKVARDGRVTAYVCERGVCGLPAQDVPTFVRQLADKPRPGAAAPR